MSEIIRLDLHRTPDISGQFLPQQDKPDRNLPLSVESIIETQKRAREFALEFASASANTALWFISPFDAAAEETRFIYEQEIKALRDPSIVIVDLERMDPDDIRLYLKDGRHILEQLHPEGKKVVLSNTCSINDLGCYFLEPEGIEQLLEEYGEKGSGLKINRMTSQARRLLEHVRGIKHVLYQDRELWIKAFGKPGEIEFLMSAYSGRSLEEVLQMIGNSLLGNLDSARLTLYRDGSGYLDYKEVQLLK